MLIYISPIFVIQMADQDFLALIQQLHQLYGTQQQYLIILLLFVDCHQHRITQLRLNAVYEIVPATTQNSKKLDKKKEKRKKNERKKTKNNKN